MADDGELRDYLRRATEALCVSNQRARDAEEARRAPVAIVAMGCRLPPRLETP